MQAAVYGFIAAVYITFAVDLVTRAGLGVRRQSPGRQRRHLLFSLLVGLDPVQRAYGGRAGKNAVTSPKPR